MKRLLLVSIAVATLVPAAAVAQPAVWNFDKNHSSVGFVARHLGFAKVRGEFREFDSKAKADPGTGKLTALEATARTKSVDTGNGKRDEHLRSDDFFNAEKHPELKLVLRSIQWSGDDFKAIVALTVRDVTKDVTFTGRQLGFQTVNFGQGPQQRTAYEASAKVNRKDFGLKFNGLAEGVAVVADDVVIELEGSFWRPLQAQAQLKK